MSTMSLPKVSRAMPGLADALITRLRKKEPPLGPRCKGRGESLGSPLLRGDEITQDSFVIAKGLFILTVGLRKLTANT